DRRQELGLDLRADVGVLLQEHPGVLTALADPLLAEREPGARLLHHALVDRVVQQLAFARDPLVVEDVELGLAKWRGDLVLHHLHLGAVADRALALLERGDAPDVHAHRGVELERAPAGGRFWRSEHDAYLHPDLIDEYDACLAL